MASPQKTKNPKTTLEITGGSKSSPAKVIAAKIAKFFIHCLGLKSLNMLYASFIIGAF